MPCIEEWLSNPLLIIDQNIDVSDETIIKQVQEYYLARIQQNGLNKIQSLNDKCLDEIKPNTLVRFRCMIQDMFEPEYYMSRYETINTSKNDKVVHLGLYRDAISHDPGHELNMDAKENITKERQCFYCVPIPAETAWAKKAESSSCHKNIVSKDPSGFLKRTLHEMEDSPQDSAQPVVLCVNEELKDNENKKCKKENSSGNMTNIGVENHQLNFPLADEKGPACIVKVYDEFESYKVNDIVEFVGVFTVDPQLTKFPNHDDSNSADFLQNYVMEIDDQNPHFLPSSVVPRLHAVVSYRLMHSNPCLPLMVSDLEHQLPELAQVKERLLKIFEDILYGDCLAAQYLLFHLFSTVYSRPDVLALGKYTLNLMGCSKDVSMTIYQVIELFVPKCCKFAMTIENINKSILVPKKDYNKNRLVSGKLQLSNNTQLVIDETVLEEGKLDNNGVQNIAAINHMISWQKLQYDFGFYKADFFTNLNVLILSEGKSVLQADSRVQVNVRKQPVSFETIHGNLDENFIHRVRNFIGVAQLVKYEISEDMQKQIEDDFVEMRQADSKGMTVERFHSLLSLARMVTISNGRKNPIKDDWLTTKHLEEQRLNTLR